jgi:inorganic phosphate transporter, PiT family
MDIGGDYLNGGIIVFAVLAVALALFFEFINGFHDTANAVATVIYTQSLPPTAAVIWSGFSTSSGYFFRPARSRTGSWRFFRQAWS